MRQIHGQQVHTWILKGVHRHIPSSTPNIIAMIAGKVQRGMNYRNWPGSHTLSLDLLPLPEIGRWAGWITELTQWGISHVTCFPGKTEQNNNKNITNTKQNKTKTQTNKKTSTNQPKSPEKNTHIHIYIRIHTHTYILCTIGSPVACPFRLSRERTNVMVIFVLWNRNKTIQ